MHHAIEYQHFSTPHLQVGARKRVPMGQLLRVTQGAALLRLGAHELLLTAGSHFWLCADALAAFTPLAGSHTDRLVCSVRVDQPAQAGWLQPTPLLDALLDSLASWDREHDWQGAYGHRLQVIQDELHGCTIRSQADQPLQSAWRALQAGDLAAGQSLMTAGLDPVALGAQWQLLQAVRLLRSGSKPAQVVAKLGFRDEAALAESCLHWHGLTLDSLLQSPSA
ncbi:hypothetical protein [Aeromonas sp. MR16]|uniref:hypothetical protein n=1 Tax=Aeromonas sp. MR16 TaxID=2923420 RepID=UPI001F4B7390|nr:hypothetical protein [Aeromonas sp. MR16]MCH7370538.1 hypothetical protein [Aeromonas sp. MR16]